MRSIIENIKEIEEENLKEVISLTNENDILKRRIIGLEKDIKGTEAAVEDSYNRGFFDAITKIKDVIDQLRPQCGQSIACKYDPHKDVGIKTYHK